MITPYEKRARDHATAVAELLAADYVGAWNRDEALRMMEEDLEIALKHIRARREELVRVGPPPGFRDD